MSLADKMDQWVGKFESDNKQKIVQAITIYKQSLTETLNHGGDKHHPSHVGEAPHRVTGQLVDSVYSEVDPATLQGTVGTRAPYGKYLLAKRNYLKIAYDRVVAQIKTIMDKY